MDAYRPLLERTRLPQPPLQRFAVIQIFDKLRTAPPYLNPNSDPGREAITQCLNSHSAAVVDQSVRELCRLVKDSKLDLDLALLDLHSALEATLPRFVNVFVKAIGFLVRFGFRNRTLRSVNLDALENHPFIKVISCRPEVQGELLQQVVLFVVHSEKYSFGEVCDYLRPLLTYSILRLYSSDASFVPFLSLMVSSLMSVWCSSPHEMDSLLDMLIGCLKCFPTCGAQAVRNIVIFAEFLVDAHIVNLHRMMKMGSMVPEAQLGGVKLLDALLTLCLNFENHSIGSKPILRLSKRLLSVHKELGLYSVAELSRPMLSLFAILAHLELEDEKLYILDFLAFILEWEVQNETAVTRVACSLGEVHLLIFPVICLMSSPSKYVKQAASRFLLLLERLLGSSTATFQNDISLQRDILPVSKPETIVFRHLQHLWLQDLSYGSFYLNLLSPSRVNIFLENGSTSWIHQLKQYALQNDSPKSSVSVSLAQELIPPEMPLLLGAVVASLVTRQSLEISALDTLAALGEMEPKLGVTLLLGVLYYSNLLRRTLKCSTDMLLKLLRVLPSLASHSAMLPLIVQTILPMLHKDSNRVLYATALRLLCKAWEMNDKVFGTLHGFLLPGCFEEFGSDRIISISMAASLRDICRRNPDMGIELILSIAVCIECGDSIIQALGLQSLGSLCEADVVDFYTAWDVISKHAKEYLADPVVAYSLCILLRWGAVDAEAYAEASGTVLQMLWSIGSRDCPSMDPLWIKARVAAFEAINHFEVSQFENSMPDLMVKSLDFLLTENDGDILRVVGELATKIIAYEHSTRRRLINEKKAPRSKIEKLLDVFPRTIFSSGRCNIQDLPGAALFCLPFNRKDVNSQGKSKTADDVFAGYHGILKEVSASLHLSRNTLLGLLSLQSWKSLMLRWLKDYISVLHAKASSTVLDITSKAANIILKEIIYLAEESIPRVAENIALAIGAYCLILPASTHAVKVTASKFLLSWLSHHEHEHRQWSAAIAIGAISSCLHATDGQQKLQCIDGLIEVACASRSSFVKGACGVGLGYACQDLLTRAVGDEDILDKASFILREKVILGKIVRALSLTICQASQISPDKFKGLCEYKACDVDYGSSCDLTLNDCDDLDVETWGVAGLVMGLGSTVTALFRAGSYDAIRSIKLLCTSWIAQVGSLVSDSDISGRSMMLPTGACLVLPTIASFCRRVDLMHDDELNDLLSSYENLISKLLMIKTSKTSYQNLLMASCVGGGALVASILGEGLFPLDVKRVQRWLEFFKTIYSGTYPDLVYLGAFLGVVNTMGADAGSVFYHYSSAIIPQALHLKEESSDINAPLLSSPSFVEHLSGPTQDMFLVAQNSDATQLQAYSAWAISFLMSHFWSKDFHGIYGRNKDAAASSRPIDQSFSKDAAVMKLTSWLMQLDFSKCQCHVNTVAAVLRCLSGAPRLPKLDWGAVVRRCMKYESHVACCSTHYSSCDKRSLLEECLLFSLAHANNFDSLLGLLDDLTSLSRFRALDITTMSFLAFHLPDLMKIFSSSRNQKLLEDMYDYFSSPIYSHQQSNSRQKRFLQLSFWKGLIKCVTNASEDTSECLYSLEKCMEALFRLLPASPHTIISKKEQMPGILWQESIACLGKARQTWLMRLLQLSTIDEVGRDGYFEAELKKMLSLAKLVKTGSIPLTELGKLKSYMVCTKSQDMWEVLVEVVAVLQTAGTARRQWLIDMLEISCITKYPSTALHFIGLLSGSSCKYMPLLILEPQAVLLDLPVTLSSILTSAKWQSVADKAVSHLWTSTERIYAWAASVACNAEQSGPHPIDPSETESRNLLVKVMLDACCRLKGFLPLKNQLQLANMVIA